MDIHNYDYRAAGEHTPQEANQFGFAKQQETVYKFYIV